MFDYVDPVVTPYDLSEYLNCGMNSVYKLLKEGKIKAFRVGRAWKIPKRAVQEYICHQAQLKAAGW